MLLGIGLSLSAAQGQTPTLEQVDVFQSGKDGYHTYRIPALLVSKKGTLLAFCEGRKNSASDTGDIDVLLKRSTDNGKTWSTQQVIWDDAANTCGNPCPVLDESTGTIWLIMTHNLGTDSESAITARKSKHPRTVWICKSDDDGKTWTKPKDISEMAIDPAWAWYATGPGVGIQMKQGPHAGRLVIPCDHSYEIPGAKARAGKGSHIIYTDDHGKTWKRGGVIHPNMNECQVVEMADQPGSLLMNMRSYMGRSCRAQSVSRDSGETWCDPKDAPALVEPICQASIIRYSWPDKDQPGCILFSNPAHENKRVNMTVRASYDEGKSWPVAKTVNPEASAYSCLAVLPDNRVGCLYECGVRKPYEKITVARFGMDWLKAK